MVIKNIKNIDLFFKTVERCEDPVVLLTKNGDRLNLKSKLSQIVTVSEFLGQPTIGEMELEVKNTDDAHKLLKFMTQAR